MTASAVKVGEEIARLVRAGNWKKAGGETRI
jgi:hypothetical protein